VLCVVVAKVVSLVRLYTTKWNKLRQASPRPIPVTNGERWGLVNPSHQSGWLYVPKLHRLPTKQEKVKEIAPVGDDPDDRSAQEQSVYILWNQFKLESLFPFMPNERRRSIHSHRKENDDQI
jgi:hypothetical protein